jgi:hypothetical protein
MTKNQVTLLQRRMNNRLRSRGRDTIKVDGKLGAETRQAVHLLKYLLGFPLRSLDTGPSLWFRRLVAHPSLRPPTYLVRARSRADYLKKQREHGDEPDVGKGDFGIDWAWASSVNVNAMKKAGVKFACRYLSHDHSKNLTASEAEFLSSAGIALVVVWETTANRALGGSPAGNVDAIEALTQARHIRIPQGRPIYFAVDFDASPAQQAIIDSYLNGAGSVLGTAGYKVGVYGGFYVVKRCLEQGSADYGWQTYAWSGGKIAPSAHIYQYSNGHTLAGVSCDYNRALKGDFGEFRV